MTPEQENLAQSLWAANRSKQQSDSSYKPKINTLREYYEKVLLLDHKNNGTIMKNPLLFVKTATSNDNN